MTLGKAFSVPLVLLSVRPSVYLSAMAAFLKIHDFCLYLNR